MKFENVVVPRKGPMLCADVSAAFERGQSKTPTVIGTLSVTVA